MRCVLIYNPVAGRNLCDRVLIVERVADSLTGEGHAVETMSTTGPGTAAGLAGKAAASADVIFACGGDGTVHEVMQGLVSEEEEPAAMLGVVPLGTANALARHLHLSLNPVTAALQQMRGTPSTIPVGKVIHDAGVRYFAVMAGAGPDGALVYSLLASHKSQMGRLAYYLHAARLFATRRFRSFEVEFTPSTGGPTSLQSAACVMAVRVDSLGGLFAGLTSGQASLHDSAFKLYVLGPPAIISLPLWFASSWLKLAALNPFLHRVETSAFSCRSTGGSAPHVQVDGEWLGRLPFQASVVPNAMRILLPAE